MFTVRYRGGPPSGFSLRVVGRGMQTNSVRSHRPIIGPSHIRVLSDRRTRGAERPVPPLAQPIEASFAKPDLNAPTSVSISASVIGVENTHAPELMMLQPLL